ncbi:MAG: hypothetical protein K2J79_07970, partial [Ruminiclostridium sp.]|nr:hypothetical protein [Ruminiclostridium sp.]
LKCVITFLALKKGNLIMIKKVKKLISLMLISAMLTCGALSSSVSAYETFGPYYYRESNKINYSYTTAIDVSTEINMTLDGNNYVKRQAPTSPQGKMTKNVATYAYIHKGIATSSEFNGNLFYRPASSSSLNEGLIVVGVAANYYVGGLAIASVTQQSASSNSAFISSASIKSNEGLTSYGTIEYRNNVDTLYAYLTTINA